MKRPRASPVVGVDYRPALVNREGIGRYTRGLVRGLVGLARAQASSGLERPHGDAPDPHAGGADRAPHPVPALALFCWTLAASRFPPAELDQRAAGVRSARLRLPSSPALGLLERLGRGIDDLPRALGGLGPVALFHHMQYRRVPVRRAREVAMLHDLCYLDDERYVAARTAERMSAFARDAARFAAAVTTPSEHVARALRARLGIADERVFVTPLGCDHVPTTRERPRPVGAEAVAASARAFGSLGKASELPLVLTVGRVDRRKNHVGALRALERLAARGLRVRWLVAGAPGFGHEAFAAALAGTELRVAWQRDVTESALLAAYDASSVLLAPAFEEGFGLTPLEAARRDLPVVAADHPVAREVLGDAALYAEASDAEALAEALATALESRERRSELVAAGRERSTRFTWEETARTTLAAWSAALAAEPPQEAR